MVARRGSQGLSERRWQLDIGGASRAECIVAVLHLESLLTAAPQKLATSTFTSSTKLRTGANGFRPIMGLIRVFALHTQQAIFRGSCGVGAFLRRPAALDICE
jgi:hypothetical protein